MTTNDRLSIREAASILGIGASSLRLLIHGGKIRFMRIGPNGGRYYFRREWLAEYERSCEVAPITSEPSNRAVAVPKQQAVVRKCNGPLSVVETLSFKEQLGALKARVKQRGAG